MIIKVIFHTHLPVLCVPRKHLGVIHTFHSAFSVNSSVFSTSPPYLGCSTWTHLCRPHLSLGVQCEQLNVFHFPSLFKVSLTPSIWYSTWATRCPPLPPQGFPRELLAVNRSVSSIPSTLYSTWATRCPPLPPQGVPRQQLGVFHIFHMVFNLNKSVSSTPHSLCRVLHVNISVSSISSTWCSCEQLGVFHTPFTPYSGFCTWTARCLPCLPHGVYVNSSVSSTPHSFPIQGFAREQLSVFHVFHMVFMWIARCLLHPIPCLGCCTWTALCLPYLPHGVHGVFYTHCLFRVLHVNNSASSISSTWCSCEQLGVFHTPFPICEQPGVFHIFHMMFMVSSTPIPYSGFCMWTTLCLPYLPHDVHGVFYTHSLFRVLHVNNSVSSISSTWCP